MDTRLSDPAKYVWRLIVVSPEKHVNYGTNIGRGSFASLHGEVRAGVGLT